MTFDHIKNKVRTANTLQTYPDFGADFVAAAKDKGLSDELSGAAIELAIKHKLGDGLLAVLNAGMELVDLSVKAKNEGSKQASAIAAALV
jgi:hypothetical protein